MNDVGPYGRNDMAVFGLETRKYAVAMGALIVAGISIFTTQSILTSHHFAFTEPSGNAILYTIYSLMDDVGGACLTAGLIGIFFEEATRDRMERALRRLIEHARSPVEVKQILLTSADIDPPLANDFEALKPGDHVDLIGIALRLFLRRKPGVEAIITKLRSGCHFRMLVLEPNSSQVVCLSNLAKEFGYNNLRENLIDTYSHSLRAIAEGVGKENIRGSIEVRLLRDIFSSISYYKSPRIHAIGIYFAQKYGVSNPMIELSEGKLSEDARAHFERLWQSSSENVFLRIEGKSRTNRTAEKNPFDMPS
jgi:hypothetical protein